MGPTKPAGTDTTYTLETGSATAATSIPFDPNDSSGVPPSHPAITSMRATRLFGIEYEMGLARKLEQLGSDDPAKYLLPSIQQSISECTPLKEYGITPAHIDKAITEVESILKDPKKDEKQKKKLIIQKLSQRPFSPEMIQFLTTRMHNQFSRTILDLGPAIATMSDVAFDQWFDKQGLFVANELLDCLKTTKFFYGKALEQDPNNPSVWQIVKYADPYDKTSPRTPLVSQEVIKADPRDPKSKSRNSYTLEANSYEGIVAMADLIAKNSQGNNNVVKMQTMGDPIIYLQMRDILIFKHHMRIDESPELKKKLYDALNTPPSPLLATPNIDNLRIRYELQNQNLHTYGSYKKIQFATPMPDGHKEFRFKEVVKYHEQVFADQSIFKDFASLVAPLAVTPPAAPTSAAPTTGAGAGSATPATTSSTSLRPAGSP